MLYLKENHFLNFFKNFLTFIPYFPTYLPNYSNINFLLPLILITFIIQYFIIFSNFKHICNVDMHHLEYLHLNYSHTYESILMFFCIICINSIFFLFL